jgi:hypothetical protein
MRRFTTLLIAGLALLAVAGCSPPPLPGTPTPWPGDPEVLLDDDVKIQFTYPDTGIDYIASVFIRHLPSDSYIGVNQDGFVSRYSVKGTEARAALCTVLHDQSVMAEVKKRAVELGTYTFGQRPEDNLPCDLLDRREFLAPDLSGGVVDQPVPEALGIGQTTTDDV